MKELMKNSEIYLYLQQKLISKNLRKDLKVWLQNWYSMQDFGLSHMFIDTATNKKAFNFTQHSRTLRTLIVHFEIVPILQLFDQRFAYTQIYVTDKNKPWIFSR